MKLEEVLPAYREGKVIVSCRGFRYQLGATAEYGDVYNMGEAFECEILGEWTIEKKKVKKEVRGWMNVYPDSVVGLYSTEEKANHFADHEKRIARVEFVHEYEVEE